MAIIKANRTINKRRRESSLEVLLHKYVNLDFCKYLVLDPAALPVVSVLILLSEIIINVAIIQRVPYTEIDWMAYMQECEGFLNGTTNYALLRGDTGPLVYPAAFVYIYTALYYITSHGVNIRLAQFVFAGIYLLQMWLVLRLYTKSKKVPPYVLVLSAFTSYRIHSIYVLRLFNDPLAVLFLYAALNLFVDHRWSLGSIAYSIGVGIKMNILLFAPAVLLFYLANLRFGKTIMQLIICGLVQLLLGAPFLLTYPLEYLRSSFDLGRIFDHKWTVNYRFLPKTLFEHKYFHRSLLAFHLLLILAAIKPTWIYFKSYVNLRELQKQLQPQMDRKNREVKSTKQKVKKPKTLIVNDQEALSNKQTLFQRSFEYIFKKPASLNTPLPNAVTKTTTMIDGKVSIHFDQCVQLALLPFFLINFIGITCARSLHYQFYTWYFHSLPHLVWSTPYSLGIRYLLLGVIEYCWNTYPSTNFSSVLLHICHLLLLIGVGHQIYETSNLNNALRKRQKAKSKDDYFKNAPEAKIN